MKWYFSKKNERLWHEANFPFFGEWSCEARAHPIEGHTPIENGVYAFGPPSYIGCIVSMGNYFVPINRDNAKGLHGGGTDAPQPYAAQQGWYPTEGCIRVQNVDLLHIVVNLGPDDTIEIMQ